ncbi:MAG TPA: hypothetical protein ENJ29_12900 [Bacteroidetes bacterium]|nr:hypothetical protein [Bacteroidota bacterium]
MTKRVSVFFRFCTVVVLSCVLAGSLQAQEKSRAVTVEQINVARVILDDPEMIRFFVTEFFIPETLVTSIEIIDVTGNGFGEKDIAVTQPSEEIYFIFPSVEAQEKMNQWQFTPNFQIVGENLDPEVYAALPTNRAANNIFSGLLRALNRNYQGSSMKLRFERNANSTLFEMWGYDNKELDYKPAPLTAGNDVIYIYTSIRDTIYVEK